MRYRFILRVTGYDYEDEEWEGYDPLAEYDEDWEVYFDLPDRDAAIRKAIELTEDMDQYRYWLCDWVFEEDEDGNDTACIPTGDYRDEEYRHIDQDVSVYQWDEIPPCEVCGQRPAEWRKEIDGTYHHLCYEHRNALDQS